MSALATAAPVRPIRPDDKAALAAFFERLSPESRRRRFLAPKPRLTARDLAFLTEVDGRDHVALVAVDPDDGIVGVARYAAWRDGSGLAEIAFAVAEDWQGRGLATALAGRLVEHARGSGLAGLTASTFVENLAARALLRRLGFAHARTSSGIAEYEQAFTAALPAAA